MRCPRAACCFRKAVWDKIPYMPACGRGKRWRLFDFGDVMLKVIDIPGHTAGAVAYLAEADGKVILFIGDMFSLQGAYATG